MTTKTIAGVELVKVGTWGASTGVTNVTREDLDAIVAAYSDPQVDRPAIKIGHTDQRFADEAAGDGEPAYGWVENPRVSEDGTTLLGDLAGIPAKLAEVIPAAFRRRSVEIAWGLKTVAGKTHRAALTGLALLGIAKPAVKGMADVLALYADGTKPGQGVTAVEQVDGIDPAGLVTLAAARAEVAKFAADHSLPDTNRDQALERLDRLSGVRDTVTVPPTTTQASDGDAETGSPNKEAPMPLTEGRVRELLGVQADADVEAAIKKLVDGKGGEDGKPGDKPAEDKDGKPTEAPAGDKDKKDPASTGDAPKDAPAATEGAPETVTLTTGALAALQEQAAQGAAAAVELAKQRRDKAITTALREGRITPAEQKTWREQMDTNEPGTVALLAALTPGRIGTSELGADEGGETTSFGSGPSDAAWAAAAKDLFDVEFPGGK